MSAISLFLDATIYVQLILILLIFSSIASWMIIFYKKHEFKSHDKSRIIFEESFWKGKHSTENLYNDIIRNKKSSIGIQRVFCAGHSIFKSSQKSFTDNKIIISKEKMDTEIKKIELELENKLDLLATIASNSPYVGLLGTVIGIMHSFTSLVATGNTTIQNVAPGIAEALFATAIALAVACPASIAYNLLISKKEKIIEKYEIFSERYQSVIKQKVESNKG